MSEARLTAPQRRCLRVLADKGPLSTAEVGDLMWAKRGRRGHYTLPAYRVLEGLAGRGLARKVKGKRGYWWMLTETGWARLERARLEG